MKKICFVLTAELAAKAFLLNHLRALSGFYEVTVIVNTNNPNFLKEQSVIAKVIPLAIDRDVSLISDFSCLIKLLKILHQENFSAVHSVTPKAGLLTMLASWVMHVPLRVHTFTGQVWVTKTGYKRLLLKQIDCLIAFLTTHNLIDSPSQRQFLIEQNVISLEKSDVFIKGSISGVDLTRFKFNEGMRIAIRQQLNIPNQAIVFLFLGRLTRDKGVLDLAQAWQDTQPSKAHLIYAGPDEQNMQAEIIRLAENDKKNIHFIGYTNTPEHYMSASDVLCLPSYREGFGSVVIEAASIGIPAIASAIYGITDAVVDGETGMLHKPRDIKAIKNCIENIINNEALRLKLGQQAQVRAIKYFDSKLITQEWVNFYSKTLK